MFRPTLPKTVERWIKKNPHIVGEVEIDDDDGFCDGDREGDYSMWIYFRPGWINTMHETHHIHEPLAHQVLDLAKHFVKKCECDECLSLIAEEDQTIRNIPITNNCGGKMGEIKV
jgi:hypothetical protein